MNVAVDVSSATRKPERGEQFFLLPPELAGLLARNGWDLGRVRDFLHGARQAMTFEGPGKTGAGPDQRPVANALEDIHPIVTGGAGIKMTYLPLWAGGTRSVTKGIRSLT